MTVPLGQLESEYGYTTVRPLRPALGVASLLLCGLLLVGVIWGGARVTSPAFWVPAALFAGVLWLTLYYFPRVRVFRFLNGDGVIVLDIFESGPDKARAEEFARRIAQVIRDHPAATPASSPGV